MKNKSFIIILALLVVILLAAVPLYRNLSGQVDSTPSGTGQQAEPIAAPDFTFYQLDGTAVNLSNFFGKPIVLNFWASSCGPCRSEMPDFQTAYDTLGDEVQFLMVNVTDGRWDTLESASGYIEAEGFTFPVFYDTDNHAAFTYGLRGLPTTFFINAAGSIVGSRSGAMSYDVLMGGINLIHH